MVNSTRRGSRLEIIARPNHSASWRTNLLVLGALSVPSLGAAIVFALAGAWPILPLAGLELAALGAALYCVNRKLQFRQVITVNDDSVQVDEGYTAPCQSHRFTRQAAALSVLCEDHPCESPRLSLYDRNGSVQLGGFLGREDALKLQSLLESELAVRTRGRLGQRAL
ncbi:MAG: DUF2244 domain-containing protein [Halioglobus sp.]|nr:DUF2244 domain-containing protein [Halioglobus sp.]